MKSKDLRSLLLKLNNYLVRNMDTATGLGIKRNHYEISIEHLFIAMLEEGQGDVPLILTHYAIDPGRFQEICLKNLDEMESGNPGKPRLSPLVTDLFEDAWIVSSVHHKENKIRSGAIFEVFIASEQAISSGLMDILSPINQEALKSEFYNIVGGSVENAASSLETVSPETAPPSSGELSAIL